MALTVLGIRSYQVRYSLPKHHVNVNVPAELVSMPIVRLIDLPVILEQWADNRSPRQNQLLTRSSAGLMDQSARLPQCRKTLFCRARQESSINASLLGPDPLKLHQVSDLMHPHILRLTRCSSRKVSRSSRLMIVCMAVWHQNTLLDATQQTFSCSLAGIFFGLSAAALRSDNLRLETLDGSSGLP
jgi:hypothetical protein